MEAVARVVSHGRAELAKAVVGQQEFIDQALLALLCGGHALIEGVPGIAKTLVVESSRTHRAGALPASAVHART